VPRHSAASFGGVRTTHPKQLTSKATLFPGSLVPFGGCSFAHPAAVGFEFFLFAVSLRFFILGGVIVEG
jgi:hypothetical protein